jgi:hypothetical protein
MRAADFHLSAQIGAAKVLLRWFMRQCVKRRTQASRGNEA